MSTLNIDTNDTQAIAQAIVSLVSVMKRLVSVIDDPKFNSEMRAIELLRASATYEKEALVAAGRNVSSFAIQILDLFEIPSPRGKPKLSVIRGRPPR